MNLWPAQVLEVCSETQHVVVIVCQIVVMSSNIIILLVSLSFFNLHN